MTGFNKKTTNKIKEIILKKFLHLELLWILIFQFYNRETLNLANEDKKFTAILELNFSVLFYFKLG